MVRSFFRHKPEEGIEEVPSHYYSESMEPDKSEYAESLMRSFFLEHYSHTHGKFDSDTGLIIIDKDSYMEEDHVKEHELIHKLLNIYRGNDNFEFDGSLGGIQINNTDHAELTQDEELAEKYGVNPELTKTLVTDKYDKLMAQVGKNRAPTEMLQMSDELIIQELGEEKDPNNHVDEILTHYLAPHSNSESMEFYNFSEDKVRKARDGIMRLDKASGFDRAELIERFAKYDTLDEFIEETQKLERIHREELNEVNGQLNTSTKSLRETVGEILP